MEALCFFKQKPFTLAQLKFYIMTYTTYKTNLFLVVTLLFSFLAYGQENPTITFELPVDASPTPTGGGLLPLPTEASPLEISVYFNDNMTNFGGADGVIDGDVIVNIVDASRTETEVTLDAASRILPKVGGVAGNDFTLRLVFANSSDVDGELITVTVPENAATSMTTGLGNSKGISSQIGFASSHTKATVLDQGQITRKTRFLPYIWSGFSYTFCKNALYPYTRIGGSLNDHLNEGGRLLFYYSDAGVPPSNQYRATHLNISWDFSDPPLNSLEAPNRQSPPGDGVYDFFLDVAVAVVGTEYSNPVPLTVSTEYTGSIDIKPVNNASSEIDSETFDLTFDFTSNTAGTYEVFITPPDEGATEILASSTNAITMSDEALTIEYPNLELPAGPDATVQHGDYIITVVFKTMDGVENLVYERATSTVTYTEQLSVEEFASATTLYPNPTSSAVNLSYTTATNTNYSLYDINGKRLATYTQSGTAHQLDVSSVSKGTYILKAISGLQVNYYRIVKE